jgi:hypothetical protein
MKKIFSVSGLLLFPSVVVADLGQFYTVETVERCDGVVMERQFFSNDESIGTVAFALPSTSRILYGTFEKGEVVEFGYFDEEPIYNENSRFDWEEWVDSELEQADLSLWNWNGENLLCTGMMQ